MSVRSNTMRSDAVRTSGESPFSGGKVYLSGVQELIFDFYVSQEIRRKEDIKGLGSVPEEVGCVVREYGVERGAQEGLLGREGREGREARGGLEGIKSDNKVHHNDNEDDKDHKDHSINNNNNDDNESGGTYTDVSHIMREINIIQDARREKLTSLFSEINEIISDN